MKYKCRHCKSDEVSNPTTVVAVTTQGPSDYDEVEGVICKGCGLVTPTWAAEVKE